MSDPVNPMKIRASESRTPVDLLRDYIRAKDENRPHLIPQVFCESACLEMRVKAENISFPAVSQGSAAIADVLVRRFNQTYENIYTFYLDKPDTGSAKASIVPAVFSCNWLVGMSGKAGGNVRVGCGRYEWVFQQEKPHRVERLCIVIEAMQTLPPKHLPDVMEWLSALDYPWACAEAASTWAPSIDLLEPVLRYIKKSA